MQKRKRKSGARYCAICGRILRKSPGPIGPVCRKRMEGGISRRKKRASKAKQIKELAKMDIFR